MESRLAMFWLFVIIVQVGSYSTSETCDTGTRTGSIQSVKIGDCDTGTCEMKKGNTYPFTITFTPGQDSEIFTVDITTLFMGVRVSFRMVQFDPKGCGNHGVQCPIKATENYHYNSTITIKSFFPELSYPLIIDVKGDGDAPLACTNKDIEIGLNLSCKTSKHVRKLKFKEVMAEKRTVKKSDGETGDDDGQRKPRSSTLGSGFKLCHNGEEAEGDCEPTVYRKLRSLTLGRRYKCKTLEVPETSSFESSKEKRKGRWNLKFNCRLRSSATESPELPETTSDSSCSCVCTGYRRTEEHHLGAGVVFESSSSNKADFEFPSTSKSKHSSSRHGKLNRKVSAITREPVIDFSKFNPDDYPTEDCDEKARAQRAWEMEEGVDPPPGYQPSALEEDEIRLIELRQRHGELSTSNSSLVTITNSPRASIFQSMSAESRQLSRISTENGQMVNGQTAHSQVDYIHCLVPDLLEISNCGFYWGKMDRYEAERLLENKPEGTFLLRDSAQEDYLFSVSFRRYSRSLHARIEQWNHKFSFDSHDPGVFSSDTVCGLIEHYKDPSCCMFFEPMLTIPLYRTFTFTLQHLSRAAICRMVTYDEVNQLQLPKSVKAYVKEYHYKQRVRVRRLDVEQ
ncbi:hypothetical protein CHUAL_004385 [Chamberlinius hualienensis]